jgi:dsDNA-binding SOS-regulon protein
MNKKEVNMYYKILLNAFTDPTMYYVPAHKLDQLLKGSNLDFKNDKKETIQNWIYKNEDVIKKVSEKKEKVHIVC